VLLVIVSFGAHVLLVIVSFGAHVLLVIVSFGALGVSAYAMFHVKAERARIAAVLDLSTTALIVPGLTLVLAVVLWIIAAIIGGHFPRLWPWVSIALVVVVWISMTPKAANRMGGVRQAWRRSRSLSGS
jgi:hypothetical protein